MSAQRHASLLAAVAFALCFASCSTPESGDAIDASPPLSNTLNWTARPERGIYGYLVYRSDDRAGPFRRIDASVVRVPADGLDKHSYTFSDEDVTAGVTYYYYLDVVSDAGLKQRFSGIISRTAAEVPDS